MTSFLAGNAQERLGAIEDLPREVDALKTMASVALNADTGDASLICATIRVAGRRVHILSRDVRIEGGSFGGRECDAVAAWLTDLSEHDAVPIVMLLDSSGARMSEGLAALGGFRRLFAAAADRWLAGVPMIVVCGRTVFGGASMLACLADVRVFFETSLFGMSGPRIVQAVAGVDDFNAENKALVQRVMGGAARAQRAGNTLIEDNAHAVRGALADFLKKKSDENAEICAAGTSVSIARLIAELTAQRAQLEADMLTRAPQRTEVTASMIDARALAHAGGLGRAWIDDGVLLGRAGDGSYLYGLVNGVWADSWHAWKLTNALITQAETAPTTPATILLDCPAHATSRALEAGMISQYFALLGLATRHLHYASGGQVTLVITGEAAGGVYVALAGGASRVLALPEANIRILPRIAIAQVRPDLDAERGESNSAWLRTGVVDSVTESTSS